MKIKRYYSEVELRIAKVLKERGNESGFFGSWDTISESTKRAWLKKARAFKNKLETAGLEIWLKGYAEQLKKTED